MRRSFETSLFAIVLALGAFSITTIFAAAKTQALNQTIFWILGLVIFSVVSQLDMRYLKNFAKPAYVFSIITLVLVLILGETIRGSVRWIDLGIFRFQPSEVAKIASILLLSRFFQNRDAQKIQNVALSFLAILPLFVLILIEPDIGSAGAIIAIWASITFIAGLKREHMLALFLSFILILVVSFEFLAPYQKDRIATFLNPEKDPLGAGYNIIQSRIAVGSGQLFGLGLGKGSQSQLNFLPESESDFIFASIAEQFGLLGAGLVISLLFAMQLKIFKIAKNMNRFGQLLTLGTLGLFLYQFTINVGMNMALIPVTGITLPFVSYGGSSLVSNLILLGMIFSAYRHSVE